MKARILVVDSWNVLSSILRTHRYQPIWAADGIQALSEARKYGAIAYFRRPVKEGKLIATIRGGLGQQA